MNIKFESNSDKDMDQWEKEIKESTPPEPKEFCLSLKPGQSGKFYIGDLGYTISDHEEWKGMVKEWFSKDTDPSGMGVFTHKGYTYFIGNTGGDGFFSVYEIDGEGPEGWEEMEHIDSLPVDAGNIGLIPWELVTDKQSAEEKGIIVELFMDEDEEIVVHYSDNYYIELLGYLIPIGLGTIKFDQED